MSVEARRWAQSLGGSPQARSTADLGWQMVRIKGTIDVESDLKPETKKKRVYWAWKRFVEWMEKEGHQYRGNLVIHGPFPHMDWQAPHVQTGENGATRLAGRDMLADLGNNGKEDYVLEAHFLTRETVQETPTDVAMNVIGQRGIRTARPDMTEGLNRDE